MSPACYTEVDLNELVKCSSTVLAVMPMGFECRDISIASDGKEELEKYLLEVHPRNKYQNG